jgi:hypothetical protein
LQPSQVAIDKDYPLPGLSHGNGNADRDRGFPSDGPALVTEGAVGMVGAMKRSSSEYEPPGNALVGCSCTTRLLGPPL